MFHKFKGLTLYVFLTECINLLDLALVFDGSGSISKSDFQIGKDFLKDVVNVFDKVGTDQRVCALD